MNFKTILVAFLSLIFVSCSKDELKDINLPVNYYESSLDFSNSIQIDSIYDPSYAIDPFTSDTVVVKFYIKLLYNSEIFGNDVFTNKINVTNEFYLNDAPHQLRKEISTNKYYIQPGWDVVKNRNNTLRFKFKFLRDEANPNRRANASNEFFFNF